MEDELVGLICIEKAKGKSNIDISKRLKVDVVDLKKVLVENKEVVIDLKKQLRENRVNRYEKLFGKAIDALREILDTNHMVDVFDKEGNNTGTKVDPNVLKVKKEVAHELLESLKIKKSSKGGGIRIDNRTANISGKEVREKKLKQLESNEVKQLLDGCTVEPKEVKFIESLN